MIKKSKMLYAAIALVLVSATVTEKSEEVDQRPTSYSSYEASGLGKFTLSLAVADIKTSYDFYQKLGFVAVKNAGSIEQRWLILRNGDVELGLFQDMFPQNTITFNTPDARPLYDMIKAAEIETVHTVGFDKNKGPCSFSFLDPDGNPILFDQH